MSHISFRKPLEMLVSFHRLGTHVIQTITYRDVSCKGICLYYQTGSLLPVTYAFGIIAAEALQQRLDFL